MKKECTKCKKRKLYSQFHVDRTRIDGRRKWCRVCNNAYAITRRALNPERHRATQRAWRQAHPERRKELWLINAYGIFPDEFRKMVREQRGRCAICEDKLLRPEVDHNHVTGQIRGLLCGPCNQGIGFLRDCPIILTKAIRYLKKISQRKIQPTTINKYRNKNI